MKDYLAPLMPESTYHIFNRASGNERLFYTKANYLYFLDRFMFYIEPYCRMLCYCLMPNHFHFVIRVKPVDELISLMGHDYSEQHGKSLSRQFSNLFNAYSKAINKQQSRKGGLFMRPYKRILISDQVYLLKLIHYIHMNPVSSNLCDHPQQWFFSSYGAIISTKPSKIERDEVLRLFDDKENFIYCHEQPVSITGIENWG